MSAEANGLKRQAPTSRAQKLPNKGSGISAFPQADSSMQEPESKLFALMRAMETARGDWLPKFETSGEFDTDAAVRMILHRKALVAVRTTKPLEIMVQATVLHSVATYLAALLDLEGLSADQETDRDMLARASVCEIQQGFELLQANLEHAAGVTANDLGLFATSGKLN